MLFTKQGSHIFCAKVDTIYQELNTCNANVVRSIGININCARNGAANRCRYTDMVGACVSLLTETITPVDVATLPATSPVHGP